MRTGLIGAMHEEIVLLEKDIDDVKIEKIGSREYYSGTISGHEVVMTLSGWGKVAASSTATSLINLFNVDRLIFIGMAGSIDPRLEIGDIVIADKTIQHDVDLSSFNFGEVESPFWKEFIFETDPDFLKKSIHAVKLFKEGLEAKKYPKIDGDYSPRTYIGAIGTGDQFVDSSAGKAKISEAFPEILCTEMEGAAIAQVCADYQIPCSVIRIISDKADETANQTFQTFLFQNISNISVEIAKLLFEE